MLDFHKLSTARYLFSTFMPCVMCVVTVLILLLVMAFPVYSNFAYLPSGHWAFNEVTGNIAKNSSNRHYSLTLNNMNPGNRVNGWGGQKSRALWFNGSNQDVSTQNKVVALQTPSITLSAWIKPVVPNESALPRQWVAAQADNYGLFVTPNERKLSFYIKNASSEGWSSVSSSLDSLNFAQWQSVAGTYDVISKSLRLYVNGKPVGTQEIRQKIGYSTGDGFTIGSMQGGRFFHGLIDEVRTYNKALSPSEIVEQNTILNTNFHKKYPRQKQSENKPGATNQTKNKSQDQSQSKEAPKDNKKLLESKLPTSYDKIPTTVIKTEIWNGPPKLPDLKLHPRVGYLEPFTDPVFGSKLKRVTDAKVFSNMDLGPGNAPAKLRHHYATCAVWNSDSTKYLLNFGQVRDSQTNELVMVTSDYTYLKEYIWSKVDPNLIYGTAGNKLLSLNIQTKKITTLRLFEGFGNLSMDNLKIISDGDRFIVISDVEAGGKKVAVYDIQNNIIVSQIDNIFDHPQITDGWHRVIPGISPSGRYVVMIDNHGDTHVFDRQLKYLRKLSLGHSHADIGYDSYGNEVLVQTCPARMVQLNNGQVTDLLGKTYGCGHVSMRNYKQPGWAIFSLSANPEDHHYENPQISEIVAVKLEKKGTNVRRLALPRSTFPYPSIDEMHSSMAVPNADGTKVIFNSAWGNPKGEINAYMIDLAPEQTVK